MLSKLGFSFTHEEFYQPTGLMHPSYILKAWPPPASASVPAAEATTATGGDSSVAAVAEETAATTVDATAARAALRCTWSLADSSLRSQAVRTQCHSLVSSPSPPPPV